MKAWLYRVPRHDTLPEPCTSVCNQLTRLQPAGAHNINTISRGNLKDARSLPLQMAEPLLAIIQEAMLDVRLLILLADAGQAPLAQPIRDLWGIQAPPHGVQVPPAPAQQHDSPQRAWYQVQQCWLALHTHNMPSEPKGFSKACDAADSLP